MKKVFLRKFCYVSIFCPVQEQQGIFAVFFRYSLSWIFVDPRKIVVCAGVLLLAVGEKGDLSKNSAMCGNLCP